MILKCSSDKVDSLLEGNRFEMKKGGARCSSFFRTKMVLSVSGVLLMLLLMLLMMIDMFVAEFMAMTIIVVEYVRKPELRHII